MNEFICRSGPCDRPFEERHDRFTISAVVGGSFVYKTDGGNGLLLYPGALLLGNMNACFECGHAHSTGDRCISFRFAPELFSELASSAAGSSRFRFAVGMLPAMEELVPLLARVEAAAGSAPEASMAIEELAIEVAEAVLGIASGEAAVASKPIAARDEGRISDVLRYLEEYVDNPIELDELAEVASLSKYHFLRTFRGVVGRSPYQYLLTLRIRRAALALLRSADPVSSIAMDAGFGDLSTFNHRFREVFRTTPQAYRQRYRRRSAG
jgi:AraC-like DNA-binding protein